MITWWNLKKSSSLRLVDSKVMWAAEMIDEEVFTQIMVNFYEISIDDLGVLIAEKITKVLDILNPELGSLSESFWKRSLKDPIEIEEALAALLLNFLQNFISQRVHFKRS
jgi:hypothetical protein